MNLDLSIFEEGEEEGIEGFSDLPIEEQMSISLDSFPINMVVNVKYPEDGSFKNHDKSIEQRDFNVVGYVTYNQPGGYGRVVNIILYPVDREYRIMSLHEQNCVSMHPAYLRHNENWLRENQIGSLLDK